MNKSNYRIDIIVDDKKLTIEGKEVELRIDGLPVYKLEHFDWNRMFRPGKARPEDFQAFNVTYLLKAAKAIFGHPDRYRIVVSLKDSPKSFTEIQNLLNFTPPTLVFHLKKLLSGMIIGKMDKKKYALTIIGEALLDYFSEFLQKIQKIQRRIDE